VILKIDSTAGYGQFRHIEFPLDVLLLLSEIFPRIGSAFGTL